MNNINEQMMNSSIIILILPTCTIINKILNTVNYLWFSFWHRILWRIAGLSLMQVMTKTKSEKVFVQSETIMGLKFDITYLKAWNWRSSVMVWCGSTFNFPVDGWACCVPLVLFCSQRDELSIDERNLKWKKHQNQICIWLVLYCKPN